MAMDRCIKANDKHSCLVSWFLHLDSKFLKMKEEIKIRSG